MATVIKAGPWYARTYSKLGPKLTIAAVLGVIAALWLGLIGIGEWWESRPVPPPKTHQTMQTTPTAPVYGWTQYRQSMVFNQPGRYQVLIPVNGDVVLEPRAAGGVTLNKGRVELTFYAQRGDTRPLPEKIVLSDDETEQKCWPKYQRVVVRADGKPADVHIQVLSERGQLDYNTCR